MRDTGLIERRESGGELLTTAPVWRTRSVWVIGLVAVLVAGTVLLSTSGREAVGRFVTAFAGSTMHVTDFGAFPDDGMDDTAGVQRALDSLSPGDTLTFPAGTYEHAAMLTARVPRVVITGSATLTATDETNSAFRVDADDVTLTGLRFGVLATTRRHSEPAQQKIWISGHRGAVMRDVTVTGSAAAGIFVQGASGFRLERVTVRDTRADGIHMTAGAHDGVVDHPIVSNTGDDGVAVVSYDGDGAGCRNITVSFPQVFGTTWGRGLSVVGGTGISYTDVLVQDSNAAAIYIAVEGDPFYARLVEDVTVRGGRLVRSNRNPDIDHGSVLVLAGRAGVPVRGVDVTDLVIENTRATASHDVGVITEASAAPPENLRFDALTFRGGPAAAFGGNTPASAYRVGG
jgi:hypothetical protein